MNLNQTISIPENGNGYITTHVRRGDAAKNPYIGGHNIGGQYLVDFDVDLGHDVEPSDEPTATRNYHLVGSITVDPIRNEQRVREVVVRFEVYNGNANEWEAWQHHPQQGGANPRFAVAILPNA
jgi:hypothetical protein